MPIFSESECNSLYIGNNYQWWDYYKYLLPKEWIIFDLHNKNLIKPNKLLEIFLIKIDIICTFKIVY